MWRNLEHRLGELTPDSTSRANSFVRCCRGQVLCQSCKALPPWPKAGDQKVTICWLNKAVALGLHAEVWHPLLASATQW